MSIVKTHKLFKSPPKCRIKRRLGRVICTCAATLLNHAQTVRITEHGFCDYTQNDGVGEMLHKRVFAYQFRELGRILQGDAGGQQGLAVQ